MRLRLILCFSLCISIEWLCHCILIHFYTSSACKERRLPRLQQMALGFNGSLKQEVLDPWDDDMCYRTGLVNLSLLIHVNFGLFCSCPAMDITSQLHDESSLTICWCWWISCVNASDNFRSSTTFRFPSDDFSRYITSTWDGMDYEEKRKHIFKLRSRKNLVAEWH